MTALLVILVVLVIAWLVDGYIQDTSIKPRKKENPWDIVSKKRRNRKATFFSREGDITIEKESR